MKLPYRFVITNDAGDYLSVGTGGFSGTIVTGSTPVYLKSSVVDWATLALNYRRDMVFLGVIRSYSPETVRFVKDAAKILRHIKNTSGGAEAIAYLGVYIFNKSINQYEFLDYWQFDFSKTKNQVNYYEVALMEGGLSALLKKNASNNYNVALNDPALAPDFPLYNPLPINALPLTPPTNNPIPPAIPKLVYLNGIPIKGKIEYVTTEDAEDVEMTSGPDSGVTAAVVAAIGLAASNTLGDYTVGRTNITQESKRAGIDAINDTGLFVASVGLACRVRIRYNLNFHYDVSASPFNTGFLRLRYAVFAGHPTIPTTWGAQIGGIGAAGIIYEDPVGVSVPSSGLLAVGPQMKWVGLSETIDLPANSILVVGFSYRMTGTIVGGESVGVIIDPTTTTPATIPLPAISLEYTFVPDSSVCRAISHGQLFEQLSAQLATSGGLLSNAYSSRSNLLNAFRSLFAPGNWDLNPQCTFFTCGDSLRGLKTVSITDPYYNGGLPFDNYLVPAIYTNMNDFAKDLLTGLCAGIGIEKDGLGTDKLVAEDLYYFFDDSVEIADLGSDISDFEMADFNDFRAGGLMIGQQDQQFDSINGPLETMSEVAIGTPMTRINKTTDFKTPYREDPYGIELIRANIGNKTNVNSSSDNDVCKLQLVGIVETTIPVLGNWTGLSGYETSIDALFLMRAQSISSGLPNDLLTPDVIPYAMYNLSFTPQRKARRALPWLCSNYRGLVDSLLGISGAKKNIKLVSNIGSGDISESDWINVSDVPQTYTPPFSTNPVTVAPATIPAGRANNLLFLPYTFTFKSKVPLNLPKLMTPPGTPGGGKMYGKIKFTLKRDGISYPLAGFVLEAGITPGTNAVYNFRLLCSPTVVIPDTL